MARGTYTLLTTLREDIRLDVGALGSRRLEAGTYAYAGSALGPGGFARLERHREVAAGERHVRHWHVDYLLGADAADVLDDVRSADHDAECAVARTLSGEFSAVPGFGASDCDCGSHLVHADDGDRLRRAVRDAHEAVTGP